jgi:hypothetical protein
MEIFTFAGQKPADVPVCDSKSGAVDTDRYKPFRFGRGVFKFALVGAGGTSLRYSATTQQIFTKGQEESGADAGWDVADWKLDEVDTDADDDGLVVDEKDQWIVSAVGFGIEPAFHITGGRFEFGPEVDLYEARAFKALTGNVRAYLKAGDKGPQMDLGPIMLHALQARMRHEDGHPLGIGAMVALEQEVPVSG